jgi:hypothetical protein
MTVPLYVNAIILVFIFSVFGLIIFKLRHNSFYCNWLWNCLFNYNVVHIDTGTEISVEDCDNICNDIDIRIAENV